MARKVDKKVIELIDQKIQENGFVLTDEIVAFVEPFYYFDSIAARRREIRRWIGQRARGRRDAQGARTTFLEKTNSEIVDIDVCKDTARVGLVRNQLLLQGRGLWTSLKKANKRGLELKGQVSLFDEAALFRDLTGAD